MKSESGLMKLYKDINIASLDEIDSQPKVLKTNFIVIMTIMGGKSYLIKLIELILTRIVINVGMSQKVSKLQIEDAANTIMFRFGYMTLSDLKLYEKYTTSKYGTDLNNFCGNTLVGWMSEYARDRASHFEGKSIEDSERRKREEAECRGIKAKPEMKLDKIIKHL
jgi:hypothetical protein